MEAPKNELPKKDTTSGRLRIAGFYSLEDDGFYFFVFHYKAIEYSDSTSFTERE